MAFQGIAIRENINVDSKGQRKPLPSSDQIAGAEFNWVCAILEVIAARLHQQIGGTTSTTTTLGLLNGCLYITNQQNKRFAGISVQHIHAWIDELALVDYDAFLRSMDLHSVYALTKGQVQRAQTADDADSKALVQAVNFVYYNVYPSFVRLKMMKERQPECFRRVRDLIQVIEVITNDQLFPKATTTTGLHGEGRFVRFLYIRYVRNLKLLEMMELPEGETVRIPTPAAAMLDLQPRLGPDSDEESGSASDSDTEELLEAARRYRKCMRLLHGEVESMQIIVASSQGTCVDCQNMLGQLRIAHNTHRFSKDSASANWVEPFMWRDIKSKGQPVERLFAARFAEEQANKLKAKMDAARKRRSRSSDDDEPRSDDD